MTGRAQRPYGDAVPRVLIADGQAAARARLRQILEAEDDLEVVGEAFDGRMAVDLAGVLHPDVVLMDVGVPLLDGVAATREIAPLIPQLRVLLLAAPDQRAAVYEALRAGASGFVSADAAAGDIVGAVRVVALDEDVLASTRQAIVAHPSARRRIRQPELLRSLTGREREVFDLVVSGLSNAEVCRALGITDATAKTHLTRVLTKLGLRGRVQLMVYAHETGVVPPPPAAGSG
jgi:DNA-binding NarL/FixJ family response regulator